MFSQHMFREKSEIKRYFCSKNAQEVNITFVDTDHEIFYTIILSLPPIQDGQLSVSSERMC